MNDEIKTINLTPKWTHLLEILILILQEGTDEGKKVAASELRRMAKAADLWNEYINGEHHE